MRPYFTERIVSWHLHYDILCSLTSEEEDTRPDELIDETAESPLVSIRSSPEVRIHEAPGSLEYRWDADVLPASEAGQWLHWPPVEEEEEEAAEDEDEQA